MRTSSMAVTEQAVGARWSTPFGQRVGTDGRDRSDRPTSLLPGGVERTRTNVRGERSNGGNSAPSGCAPSVRFAATRTLRRGDDGRTPGDEMIEHGVCLLVRQHPSRTLRLNRPGERYAKETANELTRDAKRSGDLLRATRLARTNRDDRCRFLRSVSLGFGGHFPSLRPFGDHAPMVHARTFDRIGRSAYLCVRSGLSLQTIFVRSFVRRSYDVRQWNAE